MMRAANPPERIRVSRRAFWIRAPLACLVAAMLAHGSALLGPLILVGVLLVVCAQVYIGYLGAKARLLLGSAGLALLLPMVAFLPEFAVRIWIFEVAYPGLSYTWEQLLEVSSWIAAAGVGLTVLSYGVSRWIITRRERALVWTGKCAVCGYDLRGLPENRCPECATPFDPPEAADLETGPQTTEAA